MKFFVLLVMVVSFIFGAIEINNASVKESTILKGAGAKKAKLIVSL